jgi:hypothetical protein
LIILHFDFKDNRPELLWAVWELLDQYKDWLSTAEKGSRIEDVRPLQIRPLLVLTEESDAQQAVFYHAVQAGQQLRIFGSAHTNIPAGKTRDELNHLLATMSPQELLTEPANNYRRWWNNSWYEVEEGGQARAGDWAPQDAARLHALVERAHSLGYWIRFYTLDGFTPSDGKHNGWFQTYNFGSADAVRKRWEAARAAGVDMIATDQYEALRALLNNVKAADAAR